MTGNGLCAGESINLAAAAVAGIVIKKFTRREITIILAFLTVLTSSIASLLVTEDIFSPTAGGTPPDQILPVI